MINLGGGGVRLLQLRNAKKSSEKPKFILVLRS